jgi:hypothetical protein
MTVVINQNSSGPLLDPETKVPDSGQQVVGTLMRTWRKGLKQDGERIKRFPLPTLRSQALSNPLSDLEGSAICDLLFELFLRRRVLPFKDSTISRGLLVTETFNHFVRFMSNICDQALSPE